MTKQIEERVRNIKPTYDILLYAALGMLWSLANIGYSFAFLTWFALVPLLFLLRYETITRATLYSCVFGFVFYLTNLYWLGVPFVLFFGSSGNVFLTIAGFLCGMCNVAAMSLWHGLSYGVAVFLSKYVSYKKSEIFYFVFPIIMTATDYFFPKLWHDQIGYSQFIFLAFCQIADIFGVPVITLIILSCNVAVILIIEAVILRKRLHIPIFIFLSVILVIVVSALYGLMRIDQIHTFACDAPSAKVALIQGNFSGLDKRDSAQKVAMLQTYNRLSETAADASADLIVWPETAIAARVADNVEYFNHIKTFGKTPLLFGTITTSDNSAAKRSLHNSVILVDAEGKHAGRYDKNHLIPFAEYMPLIGLSRLMKLYGLISFAEGRGQAILTSSGIRLTPNICYEDLLPDYIRHGVRMKQNGQLLRSNLIINVSNDSWFGRTNAAKMHLQISVFRAIENRRSLVRATCTGYSMICMPTGEIADISARNEECVLINDVILNDEDTVYNGGGWVFVYILLAAALAIPFVTFLIRWHRYVLLQKILNAKRHQERLYRTWAD